MNVVWFILIALAVLVAAITGRLDATTDAAMNSAKAAVELAIGLIGVMALWLGLMKVAEKAGLVRLLARALRPVLVRLFPEVPAEHPAMGSMLANIAANMLGLGNSATALGLRAMQDLQELNREKESASNAMATFLAINTSSVTLIPATVIAIRVAAGSTAPAEIIGPTLVATAVSTAVAIITVRLLQRVVPPQGAGPAAGSGEGAGGEPPGGNPPGDNPPGD
ncbi:MAG TPA: hypothetical protein ENI92_08075, partial [Bacteroidetes bacterium]|nr:hypothetical protein [Bacteroidota bacterium]